MSAIPEHNPLKGIFDSPKKEHREQEAWRRPEAWPTRPVAPPPMVQPQLDFPPGFAGEMSKWLCNSVAQSVREAGIAGALGMLAGINGGAYTVSQPPTGLNLFVLLLALSGLGKEAMHRIHHLMHVACNVPDMTLGKASLFVRASKPVSEAALSRALSKNPCHVSVQGEFCRTLREISEAKTSSALYGLMTLMLALFEKSGPQSLVGGREYSDAANNVQEVRGAAYSVLGEGTPGTFYDSLTESMMENGFLSRLTVLDSPQLEVPERNLHPVTEPPEDMLAAIRWMLITAVSQIGQPVHVPADEPATAALEAFRKHCVDQLNMAGRDERRRAPWTRAYMKAYRVAGNLAVADHWKERYVEHLTGKPCPQLAVRTEHVEWAVALERRNIAALTSRIEGGDAGSDDHTRELKILEVIKRYWTKPLSGGNLKYDGMRTAGIVPRAIVQSSISRVTAFSTHRNGTVRAMDEALRSLCDSGHLMECDKRKLFDEFGVTGKAYRLLSMPD